MMVEKSMGADVMKIIIDDLSGREIQQLIYEHLADMSSQSPPESTHALNLDGLKSADVTVWSCWEADTLLGCAAIKELNSKHGEIKSMRTAKYALRKGVAGKLLDYLISEAQTRGYTSVSLETGSMAAFEPARKLYESRGFHYCQPFAQYKEDQNSVFMTRTI